MNDHLVDYVNVTPLDLVDSVNADTTDLFWGQASHVWNNTGTENAYLVNTNGVEITKKSCR